MEMEQAKEARCEATRLTWTITIHCLGLLLVTGIALTGDTVWRHKRRLLRTFLESIWALVYLGANHQDSGGHPEHIQSCSNWTCADKNPGTTGGWKILNHASGDTLLDRRKQHCISVPPQPELNSVWVEVLLYWLTISCVSPKKYM